MSREVAKRQPGPVPRDAVVTRAGVFLKEYQSLNFFESYEDRWKAIGGLPEWSKAQDPLKNASCVYGFKPHAPCVF